MNLTSKMQSRAPDPHARDSNKPVRLQEWISRHALTWEDSNNQPSPHAATALDDLARDRDVVALGESAHGTHTQLTLKHQIIRHLVEHAGFRTLAWEEGWGSGVAIDRYITTGGADPTAVVGDAMFMLQTQAMLEFITWMRDFNQRRPPADQVRFIGADVLELRSVQFTRIRQLINTTAPEHRAMLEEHLEPIDWRGSPSAHLRWFMTLEPPEQDQVVSHAHAVLRLVADIAAVTASAAAADAVQDAHALLGFYRSHTQSGRANNLRDQYIAAIIRRWHDRTGHRTIYSAATVHTAATPRVELSMPRPGHGARQPAQPFAGGLLREQFGRRYASIAISFDHGDVLTGWEVQPGGPRVYHVPSPAASLTDHTLASATHPAYLLPLDPGGNEAASKWVDAPARLRLVASAYHPDHDADHSVHVDSLGGAFDAILHTTQVEPSQLLGS